MQRRVIEMDSLGYLKFQIIKETKLSRQAVDAIIEHGIVMPDSRQEWRCWRCGVKIKTNICMACEVRQMGGKKC
jgi:hypothetical protein